MLSVRNLRDKSLARVLSEGYFFNRPSTAEGRIYGRWPICVERKLECTRSWPLRTTVVDSDTRCDEVPMRLHNAERCSALGICWTSNKRPSTCRTFCASVNSFPLLDSRLNITSHHAIYLPPRRRAIPHRRNRRSTGQELLLQSNPLPLATVSKRSIQLMTLQVALSAPQMKTKRKTSSSSAASCA